jgi:hypothetical protein
VISRNGYVRCSIKIVLRRMQACFWKVCSEMSNAKTPGVPGDDVLASTSGTLVSEFNVPTYGNAAVIERDNGDGTYSYFLYGHLAGYAKKFELSPKEPTKPVGVGEVIGQMGNSGSSAEGEPIPVHNHFEQINTNGRLDFSHGWPLKRGPAGVTDSGVRWERTAPSFQLPNGWVATSDNGRISATIPPEQFSGAQRGAAAQPFLFPDATQLAQHLTAENYFGNYAPASNGGSDIANTLAPFESPRTAASGPVPSVDLTKAAQHLFAKVPPSDFPVFPSWMTCFASIMIMEDI